MGTRKSQKTHIVSWYGPFHSVEEMKEWKWQNKPDVDFCLYLLQGKKPYAKTYSYYCGQTTRGVSRRLKDRDHHIKEIPNRRNIWIGSFENPHNNEDINIAENMFISLLSLGTNEGQCINRQNTDFSKHNYNVFFICKWHNPKHYRQPECSLKSIFPEIVAYFSDTNEVKIARKLHSFIKLE